MFSLNISLNAENKNVRLTDLKRIVLEYAQLNVSPKTYRQYGLTLNNLITFLHNEKLCHICKTDIQNFIAARKQSFKPNGEPYSLFTLNIELAVIKKAFSIAVEKKWIPENPAKGIKKFDAKSEVPAFDNEQLELFLDTLKSNTKNIHYYYAVVLALNTGMRQGEIINLKWSQIDFKTYKIELKNKITKKIEYAYFNDKCLNIFNILRQSNIISSEGYIWGRILNQRNLNHTFTYWRDKLCLPRNLRFHSCRHTAITHWVQKHPLDIAQDLARHSSPEMTKKYIHRREEELRKAINDT